MTSSISERSERALLSLFPRVQGRADAATWLVDQLVDAELHRVGMPDPTGAFQALALTQGSLLKEEYDLSTHGHATDGWHLGAVVIDPIELTLFNMRYGFEAGDRALKTMVSAMKATFASAKVVRVHTDGFAILFGPTSERRVEAGFATQLRQAVAEAVDTMQGTLTANDDEVPPHLREKKKMSYTVGCFELTVLDPPNWQILGPLVWAEAERTLTIAKRQPFDSVLRRTIDLKGRLPAFE